LSTALQDEGIGKNSTHLTLQAVLLLVVVVVVVLQYAV